MKVNEEFLAGLEKLPPHERAKALMQALTNVVAGVSTLADGQWEPEDAAEIWMSQLLAATVEVYNAMLKQLPEPLTPEEMN